MPKTPINYQDTIIYKICCNDLNIPYIYVGHTTNFVKRKAKHKSTSCNINSKMYNFKVYQTIRENGNWENWSMIKIEDYPCSDKLEALKRERFWYETLNADLNDVIPFRSKEEVKINNKLYRQKNSEHLKENYKNYRQAHLDKIKTYEKKYRDENKERILKRDRDYYYNNREQKLKYYHENKHINNMKRQEDRKQNIEKYRNRDKLYDFKRRNKTKYNKVMKELVKISNKST